MKSSLRQFLLPILALLFTSTANCQIWSWVQDDLYLNPSGVQIEKPAYWAWGDVNEDGFVDIVISKWDYDVCCGLKVFAGTIRSQPPYWIESPEILVGLEAYRYGPIAIVDLDGDGVANIVTLGFETGQVSAGRIDYWRKDASGIW